MPFSFKQFHIDDSRCGMAVSTDGVVLGAWAPLAQAKRIVDIGAGSGLLSLMAAQRSQAKITAVEIDNDAALDCQSNIDASPWAHRIELQHQSVLHWASTAEHSFDHIVCNPPYFANGPQSEDQRRATARHTDSLDFDSLLGVIGQIMSEQGQASLILPSASLSAFISLLNQHRLALLTRVDVISVEGKTPHRHLLLLGHQAQLDDQRQANEPQIHSLTIRTPCGRYSPEMVALTQAFYLKL
ncbi:methyltransferase [Shewanella sp. Isolate11]|uniref:tRNA1(Val) (adenine(37)-N6)-methyltransferase n=1 Tax=Shewanella sp. Isolate11 TaxID=2908530 RepID=UPI001EFCF302|nr:methyltransferase [Shewanella sp. Isolate11]MCG9695738.1 methyltransferase [Shewanella sp. Isolate11]